MLSRLFLRASAKPLVACRFMGGAVGHLQPGTVSSKTGLPVRDTPHPRPPSDYFYEDRLDKPMPTVPFVEDPSDAQKVILAKMEGDWKKLTNEEKAQLYRMRFQWSMDELNNMPVRNWMNIWSGTMLFFWLCMLNYLLLSVYMWDRTPRPQIQIEPRCVQLRCRIKKFMNKCSDIVDPAYLNAKYRDEEIDGVSLP